MIDRFEVVNPLIGGHIDVQIVLAQPSERSEEITQPLPESLHRVGVYLSDAVPIIVPGPLFCAVADSFVSQF